MTRNVLVTGGAGFIGSAVCRHLFSEGADGLNVDGLTYAGNLRSPATVDNAPNDRFAKNQRLRPPGCLRGGSFADAKAIQVKVLGPFANHLVQRRRDFRRATVGGASTPSKHTSRRLRQGRNGSTRSNSTESACRRASTADVCNC
jgi:hypothetical protein